MIDINNFKLLTDKKKLEKVVEVWGFVQEENYNQKNLVTTQEWDAWDKYNKSESEKLSQIIDNFRKKLSSETVSYLERLVNAINGAQHLDENQLIERNAKVMVEQAEKYAAEEERKKEAQDQATIDKMLNLSKQVREEEELKSFKEKLFGFFKREK